MDEITGENLFWKELYFVRYNNITKFEISIFVV